MTNKRVELNFNVKMIWKNYVQLLLLNEINKLKYVLNISV